VRTATAAALILAVGLLPTLADAQDRCAGASTQLSINECAGAKLTQADGAMTALYRALMDQLSPKAKAGLRDAQRAWLGYRDQMCAFEGLGTTGGSMQPMILAACRVKLTNERAAHLKWHLTCDVSDSACTRAGGRTDVR
jgi:uncharacterized protein YecT (DUF1311 family)